MLFGKVFAFCFVFFRAGHLGTKSRLILDPLDGERRKEKSQVGLVAARQAGDEKSDISSSWARRGLASLDKQNIL